MNIIMIIYRHEAAIRSQATSIIICTIISMYLLLYADDLVLLAPDSRSLEAALLVLDQVGHVSQL